MSVILHIAHRTAWQQSFAGGYYTAPSLYSEGFIHCSTTAQAIETANRLFRNDRDLVLLCIDEEKLEPDVKYEAPKGTAAHDLRVGEVFPHLYGPINVSAVIRVVDLVPQPDGSFELPSEIEDLLNKDRRPQ